MLPAQRQKEILSLLAKEGAASVRLLAERFDVSQVTIRRDLQTLEKQGLIHKTHGGAVALEANTYTERQLQERETEASEEKDRIGRRAAQMVKAGDTVILDEGSTCLAVARHLRRTTGITVITNGIRVAAELLGCPGITLVVIGGVCHHDSAMLYGPETERAYQEAHAERYFMGIDAFSEQSGIMDGNLLQVSLKQAKAQASRRVIGVAHRAKFGRLALARVGPLNLLDSLVTDAPVDSDLRGALERAGVECIEA